MRIAYNQNQREWDTLIHSHVYIYLNAYASYEYKAHCEGMESYGGFEIQIMKKRHLYVRYLI